MLNRWMNSKTNYELKEQNTMSEIEFKTQSSATEREGGGEGNENWTTNVKQN